MKIKIMIFRTITYILILCILQLQGASSKCCEKFIFPNDKNNFSNLKFRTTLLYSTKDYVVGFSFSDVVQGIEVYGKRKEYKVNDTFWFVTLEKEHETKIITFDILITASKDVVIDGITLNGETLCTKYPHTPQEIICPSPSNEGSGKLCVLTLVFVILFGVALTCLAGVSIRSIITMKRLAQQHWYDTYNLVLPMSRRISETNNPNVKGVPLPEIPPNKFGNSKRGTYIDLKTYQCPNPSCHKTYGILLDAMSKITYDECSENIQEEEADEENGDDDQRTEEEKNDKIVRERKLSCYNNPLEVIESEDL